MRTLAAAGSGVFNEFDQALWILALRHVRRRSIDGFLGGTHLVGIFNAQDEFTLHMSSVQPVEYRRSGVAQMQIAGRTRRKASDDLFHVCHLYCLEVQGSRFNVQGSEFKVPVLLGFSTSEPLNPEPLNGYS